MANAGPTWTREYSIDALSLEPNSVYLRGPFDDEDRFAISAPWRSAQEATGVIFYEADENADEELTLTHRGDPVATLLLYDLQGIMQWFTALQKPIYIDVTSLALRAWAPVLRALVAARVTFRVVYTEPRDYHRNDADGGGFDLSELTEGIAAVPGFARIADTSDDDVPFIPLLGFEGARLTRMLQKLEVPRDLTYPVIGLPGYRVEFPFYALAGNRSELERGGMHARLLLARANCPFDAFFEISRVHERYARSAVQVAPIGTKPHAVGAVLYAILHHEDVELVYDHPRRASQPSAGASRVCVYYVSDFLSSEHCLQLVA